MNNPNPFFNFQQIHLDDLLRTLLTRIRLAQGIYLGSAESIEVVSRLASSPVRVKFPPNSSNIDKARALLVTAFALLLEDNEEARDIARQCAQSGLAQSTTDKVVAGFLVHQKKSIEQTTTAALQAKGDITSAFMRGAESYFDNAPGNAVTDFLRNTFAAVPKEHFEWLIFLMLNGNLPTSPWNPLLVPALSAILNSGLPVNPMNTIAAANRFALSLPPWQRQDAIIGLAQFLEGKVSESHPEAQDYVVYHMALAASMSVSRREFDACRLLAARGMDCSDLALVRREIAVANEEEDAWSEYQ